MFKLFRALLLALIVVPVGLSRAQELPDGSARELVEAACTACHETSLITGSAGFTHEQWGHLMTKMVDLPESVANDINQYLAENFPGTYDRRPNLVPGDVEISFQEWNAPTLGQRPRDPLMTPDGMIWWSGMYASLIGRLDPATGEMTEFRLDVTARPHSIINDAGGNIWYTGNGNGTLGMLNPETGEITVYPMPDPEAKDPHTPYVAQNGDVWFSVQHSDMLGRLDPETGEIRLKSMPREGAKPYGVREDSKGMLWVAYRGSNAVARVDPQTWEITEYETPNPDPASHHGRHYVRRLAIDSNDIIWYADAGRGYLGRLDPATGEITEWPSPSGPTSHPYAIEVIDDIVWYNESNQRPDALVRFDPETESFQSWAVPSGVGIIRNMRETPDGNLVIHQSSTNTVGLVTIPPVP